MTEAVSTGLTGRDLNNRWTQIDILRGMLLALMAFNHTPNPLRSYTDQPLGFVSAAEGFVFLSAFLSGLVFERRARERGVTSLFSYAWKRAWKLYLGHLATLIFAFLVAGLIFAQLPGFSCFVGQFHTNPVKTAGASLVFLFQPPLFDILPMYVLFVLLTPVFFRLSARAGWWPLLACSGAVWIASHFQLRGWLLSHLDFLSVVSVGPFDIFSWQLLWVTGLVAGQFCGRQGRIPSMPAGVGVLALATSLFFFCWRATWVPFSPDLGQLVWVLDKWELGPLRLLNFFAIASVLVWTAPRLGPMLDWLKPFGLLGRNSLPVYCIHLCICLVLVGLTDSFDIPDGLKLTLTLVQIGCLFLFAFLMNRRRLTASQR